MYRVGGQFCNNTLNTGVVVTDLDNPDQESVFLDATLEHRELLR